MKNKPTLLLAIATGLALPCLATAATLTQAKITQIVKDVKTIDPAKGARPSSVNETLQGQQSVSTGVESRTELLFNDQTITRLGANTHFSFSEGTRNMSLDRGVMLLQVPKGIGGAKIQTAAVTAAVTGTTIMIEAGKDYTKLIVLEGECCLWPRTTKKEDSKFYKMRHKVCATAGQEIILRNGAKEIPDAFYVNLNILVNSSKLTSGNWKTDIDHEHVDAAIADQTPKDYIPTNVAIIGAGTDALIIQEQNIIPGDSTPPTPPSGSSTGPTTPGKYGALTTISSPNPYVIGGTTTIVTDPTITTGGVTSYGKIYRGAAADGALANYLFGANSGFNPAQYDFTFQNVKGGFPANGMAVFKFSDLVIQGQPTIDLGNGGPNNLALISLGNILFSASNPTTIDFSPLNGLLLAAVGEIDVGSQFTLSGLSGFLKLAAVQDITVNAEIYLYGSEHPETAPADLFINTGGKLFIGNSTRHEVSFQDGVWFAKGGMFIGGDVTAENSLKLDSLPDGDITLGDPDEELGGSINARTLDIFGKNVNIHSDETVDTSDYTAIVANGLVDVNGSVTTSKFTVDTTGGTGFFTESNKDFWSSNGSGYVSAPTIKINSRGTLYLDEASDAYSTLTDKVNDVQINHNNIESLTLTGSDIIVSNGFDTTSTDNKVTLNLTSANNIAIDNAIVVDTFLGAAGGGYFDDNNNFNTASGAFDSHGDFTAYGESYIGSVGAKNVYLKVGVDGTLANVYDSETENTDTTFNDLNLDLTDTKSLTLFARNLTVGSDFNEPKLNLSLTSNFDSDGNGGDIIIQGAVNVSKFTAVAARSIYGSQVVAFLVPQSVIIGGSALNVSAKQVDLTLGLAATLTQDTETGLATLNTVTYFQPPPVEGDPQPPVPTNRSLDLILNDETNPTNYLSVTTGGDLTVGSSGFADTNFFSDSGFDYINLRLTANYDKNSNASNIVINGNINVDTFYANATNEIFGTGVVTAYDTTLQVGVDATLSSTEGGATFSYSDSKSITLSLVDSDNPTKYLTLSANKITVASDFSESLSLTLNSSTGFTGSGSVAANTISLNAGSVDGTLTQDANGAYFNTPDPLKLILNDADIPANTLTLSAQNMTVASGFIAPPSSPAFTLNLNAYLGNLNVNGAVSVNGADAVDTVNGTGGDGGTVSLYAQHYSFPNNVFTYDGGDININKPVTATTGKNGSAVTSGGNGGTATFTAYGAVNINDKVEVSSNSGGRASAKGGTVSVTSHKVTGTAIHISNSGQINALLSAAASPANGGAITLVADKGGNILVEGRVQADHGTVDIHTTSNSSGNVSLSGATLSADVVKVGALGSNGTLTIGGGSINGDTAIKLYAGGSNGNVNFVSNTSLTGASVKSIAANTVTVNNGVQVNVSGPAATVYTNHPNYSGSGGNSSTTGQFTGTGASTQPFNAAGKPAF